MDSYKWATYIEFLRLMLGIIFINNITEFENFNSTNFYFMFSVFLILTVSNYLLRKIKWFEKMQGKKLDYLFLGPQTF